jgi:protein associated with RNAse G/E
MKTGDMLHVRACKTDGTVYRSWHTTIESVEADSIVTISPAGDTIQDLVRGQFVARHSLRSYYWHDRFYNLIEVFETDGTLLQVYINIASPPWFEEGHLCYIDHELDVFKVPHQKAKLIDEDEFAEAVVKYRYTDEFQQKMYRAAREAIDLANHWQAKPVPTFGGNDA